MPIPPNVERAIESAQAHEAVWRYCEAIELYERARNAHPDDYRLYLGAAHRLIRLRDFQGARRDLERAKTLVPTASIRPTCSA